MGSLALHDRAGMHLDCRRGARVPIVGQLADCAARTPSQTPGGDAIDHGGGDALSILGGTLPAHGITDPALLRASHIVPWISAPVVISGGRSTRIPKRSSPSSEKVRRSVMLSSRNRLPLFNRSSHSRKAATNGGKLCARCRRAYLLHVTRRARR